MLLLLAVVRLLLSRVRLVLGVGAAPARGAVGPSVLAARMGARQTLHDSSAVAAGHDAGQHAALAFAQSMRVWHGTLPVRPASRLPVWRAGVFTCWCPPLWPCCWWCPGAPWCCW